MSTRITVNMAGGVTEQEPPHLITEEERLAKWDRLYDLASRLGVKPFNMNERSDGVLIETRHGMVDLIDVANALLDKIDAATQEKAQ